MPESEAARNVNGAAHSTDSTAMRANPSLGVAIRIRFGRLLWRTFHGLADGWPCSRCRPRVSVWMQGLHDAVNLRLGKRPFRPESFARYESGDLEGPYHRACLGCRVVRVAARWIARAGRPRVPHR